MAQDMQARKERSPATTPLVAVQNIQPDAGKCGYEMPFPETAGVSVNTPTTEADPAKLCTALADALASGKVRDVSALRAKLLDLGPAAVPSVSALLNAGTPSTEVEAVRLLVQIGSQEALAAALGKMLTLSATGSAYNRYLAAFADCRSAPVAAWLTDFLGRAQTAEVRQRVLAILAALRGPEVVRSLAAQLAKPADQMHADDCAGTLATASDPTQTGALRDLLEAGESPEMQALAAYGLASVGNHEACAALMEKGSSAEAIAPQCRDALANVDSSYGQETLIQAAVSPAVPSAVRCSAVQALSNQQGQRVQTVLANLGQATSDPALQTAICQALQSAEQSGTPPQSGGTAGNAGIDGEVWF